MKLLPLVVALSLVGCQWSPSVLRGNADVEVDIPSSNITKILSVTKRLMQSNGYQTATDGTNQEVPFIAAYAASLSNRVLCFSNGRRNRVWVIAQPTGFGWRLYCLPEPEGYDTSFAQRNFQRILQSVRVECSKPGLLTNL
jgi:hypothetical protein